MRHADPVRSACARTNTERFPLGARSSASISHTLNSAGSPTIRSSSAQTRHRHHADRPADRTITSIRNSLGLVWKMRYCNIELSDSTAVVNRYDDRRRPLGNVIMSPSRPTNSSICGAARPHGQVPSPNEARSPMSKRSNGMVKLHSVESTTGAQQLAWMSRPPASASQTLH